VFHVFGNKDQVKLRPLDCEGCHAASLIDISGLWQAAGGSFKMKLMNIIFNTVSRMNFPTLDTRIPFCFAVTGQTLHHHALMIDSDVQTST
jgi:hypothetical protein